VPATKTSAASGISEGTLAAKGHEHRLGRSPRSRWPRRRRRARAAAPRRARRARWAAAAEKSEHAGGYHVAIAVTLGFPGGSEGQISGAGAFDGQADELGLDLSNLLQNTPLPLGSGRGVEARFLPESGAPMLYLRAPYLDSQLPPGKRWFRLDLQSGGNTIGNTFTQLLGRGGQSPSQMLDLLRATGHVTDVGPNIVGGAKVTRYRGVVDLRQAAKLDQGAAATVARALASADPATISVDVWIGDGDGLVHQIRSSASTTLTTISRWGSRVAVAPPPRGQVVDATGRRRGRAGQRVAAARQDREDEADPRGRRARRRRRRPRRLRSDQHRRPGRVGRVEEHRRGRREGRDARGGELGRAR
jgi:hypothetical protein